MKRQGLPARRLAALLLAAALLAAGCSGGVTGGGGGSGFFAGGGTGGTGVHVGSVSKFGSVFVNGVEFDTAEALVVLDGVESGSGDQAVTDGLAVGKVVRIEGEDRGDGTGTAARVVYNEDILGPVQSVAVIDSATRRFVVMGQTVVADAGTAFAQSALETLAEGNLVEVSGFLDADGSLRATFIGKRADRHTSGDAVELRGVAQDVDPVQRTFRVNDLTVDYSAADTGRLAGGAPAAGQYLEIDGVLDGGGILAASRVAPEDILGVDDAELVEIAGVVTAFESISAFAINGIAVAADAETAFEGILAEEIALGAFITVRGPLVDRVIQAELIRSASTVRAESDAAAATADALTLAGLEGLTVGTNALTRILGAADSLEEIQPGWHVKVFGRTFAPGTVTAEKLIVMRQPKKKIELTGPVEEVYADGIQVLGVDIQTAEVPANAFRLRYGGPLTPGEFLDRVAPGDVVSAVGKRTGPRSGWESIELEEN
jgi:hypothetical protein